MNHFHFQINELLVNDSVAISGGVAFYENEYKCIMPSCCAALKNLEKFIIP